MKGLRALISEAPESFLPFSMLFGLSVKIAISGPGNQFSSDTESSGTLILNSGSRTVRNKYFLFISHHSMVFCYNSLSWLRHSTKVSSSEVSLLRIDYIFMLYN